VRTDAHWSGTFDVPNLTRVGMQSSAISERLHAREPIAAPGKRSALAATDAAWWQRAIIYQIYPRSFQDSNDDGIGDLPGIERRLPYLKELGIDAIWLSPIFPSPQRDFGYDIANYIDIDPIFGTLQDFDRLLAAAHGQGLKLLLDLVPNHTSDQHPWFRASRRARSDPQRDWYIWRDPAPGGGPPNNWLSQFGGSAWEFDAATGQYYYHAFLREQPDLNWRNPNVRRAVHDVMRFWLARGVDGFRVDVIWQLLKDQQFRDNPVNPDWTPSQPPSDQLIPLYTADLPEVHDVIAELRRVINEFDERVLIGEIYLPIEKLVAYYGRDLTGVHLPFNFALLSARWNARALAALVDEYEAALPAGGWPNWVLSNHDRPRVAARVGPEQARLAAILLLTLRGTPTIYYGDEIGISQVDLTSDQVRDPLEHNIPGLGIGRDGARTPMQWDGSTHAGFSHCEPWLPLAADHQVANVATQRHHETSILNLYRRLIAARRAMPVLSLGSYRPVAARGDLLLFLRQHATDRVLVALNLGTDATTVEFGPDQFHGQIIVSAHGDRDEEPVHGRIDLRAGEGLVIVLTPDAVVP
jgi:alpha-glucosidase